MPIDKRDYLADWKQALFTDINLDGSLTLQLCRDKTLDGKTVSAAISLVKKKTGSIDVLCSILNGENALPSERKNFSGQDCLQAALDYRAEKIREYDADLFKE